MAEPYPSSDRDRWRPGARFVIRTGHRALAESLYLLIAPVITTASLLGALAGRPGAEARSAALGRRGVRAAG